MSEYGTIVPTENSPGVAVTETGQGGATAAAECSPQETASNDGFQDGNRSQLEQIHVLPPPPNVPDRANDNPGETAGFSMPDFSDSLDPGEEFWGLNESWLGQQYLTSFTMGNEFSSSMWVDGRRWNIESH